MTEPKHTPGPWRVDPDYPWDIQNADGSLEIASVNPYRREDGEDGEVGDADARLIAAAPDLLEALRVIAESDITNARKVALSAIAKAEGR